MTLTTYLIYLAVLLLLPMLAQGKVKSTYAKYSRVPIQSQKTGAQVARQILDENGLYDVTIEPVKGVLSDHYDPRKKVVRLSEGNYRGHSMAAAAVAAHEVGHAIQDAEEYAFLKFRTALVPLATFGSGTAVWIILAGFFLDMMNLALVGVIFMAFAVLFQIVTLPVEFNASSRAMDQLIQTGILQREEEAPTKKVLNAAALTYVAATLVAVAELLRYLFIILGNRD